MLTAIFKLKTDLPSLAQECQELFGEGSRSAPDRVEHTFALCNTIVEEGHLRIVVAQHIALALEYVTAQGYVSPNAELVKLEWDGQEEFALPSGQLLGVIV